MAYQTTLIEKTDCIMHVESRRRTKSTNLPMYHRCDALEQDERSHDPLCAHDECPFYKSRKEYKRDYSGWKDYKRPLSEEELDDKLAVKKPFFHVVPR